MLPPYFEVSIILVLILINGLLSMTEIALVSSRKARLQQRVNEGDKKAQTALDLANEPTSFLATVQIGITLVGVLAGAFGGATLARTVNQWLIQIPAIEPYSASISFIGVVLIIGYLSLLMGELVPKRLALNNPEKVASVMAAPMKFLTKMANPLVSMLSLTSDVVLKLMGVKAIKEAPVTEEEVKVMIEQGTQAGVFEAAEQDMLVGVFRLGDLRVEHFLTPRTEIEWLDIDDTTEEHKKIIIDSGRSRFPVAQGSLDNVMGVVQAKDILVAFLKGGTVDLRENLREPLFVPESMPALKVLELIGDTRLPMVLVIDEFGGLQGLVTVNDILEAIVGDISVRGEKDEPEIVKRDDGSYLLDGMLTVDEVSELLKQGEYPGLKEGHFQTLAGFVITYMGRIPSSGDYFEWEGMRFEIMDMDGLRVDKVLVSPLPGEHEETPQGLSED
jgi:putative hemolysin